MLPDPGGNNNFVDISISNNSSIFEPNRGPWSNKFVVVALETNPDNKTFKNFSPFKVSRCFKSIAPSSKLRLLKSGSIILEVTREQEFYNLRNLTHYENYPVKFTLHRTLNYSKGIISCEELKNCSDDELKEELARYNVVNVKRIYKTIEGVKVLTNSLILTFQSPELPKRILFDFLSVRVEPYVKPLQCFKCYSYRHGISNCKNEAVCGRCGQAPHDGNCEAKCKHCAGPHPAWSTKCPSFLNEKKIEEYKLTNKVSYVVAEKRLSPPTGSQPAVSYTDSVTALPTTNALLQQLSALTNLVTELNSRVASLDTKVSQLESGNNIISQGQIPSTSKPQSQPPVNNEQSNSENSSNSQNSSVSKNSNSQSHHNAIKRPKRCDSAGSSVSLPSSIDSQTKSRIIKKNHNPPHGQNSRGRHKFGR